MQPDLEWGSTLLPPTFFDSDNRKGGHKEDSLLCARTYLCFWVEACTDCLFLLRLWLLLSPASQL